MSKKIKIRSEKLEGAEVSWFAPICDGDDRYLGERNIKFKSNWAVSYTHLTLPTNREV